MQDENKKSKLIKRVLKGDNEFVNESQQLVEGKEKPIANALSKLLPKPKVGERPGEKVGASSDDLFKNIGKVFKDLFGGAKAAPSAALTAAKTKARKAEAVPQKTWYNPETRKFYYSKEQSLAASKALQDIKAAQLSQIKPDTSVGVGKFKLDAKPEISQGQLVPKGAQKPAPADNLQAEPLKPNEFVTFPGQGKTVKIPNQKTIEGSATEVKPPPKAPEQKVKAEPVSTAAREGGSYKPSATPTPKAAEPKGGDRMVNVKEPEAAAPIKMEIPVSKGQLATVDRTPPLAKMQVKTPGQSLAKVERQPTLTQKPLEGEIIQPGKDVAKQAAPAPQLERPVVDLPKTQYTVTPRTDRQPVVKTQVEKLPVTRERLKTEPRDKVDVKTQTKVQNLPVTRERLKTEPRDKVEFKKTEPPKGEGKPPKGEGKGKIPPIIPWLPFPKLRPVESSSGVTGGASVNPYIHFAKEYMPNKFAAEETQIDRTEIENVARPNSKREKTMSRNQSIKKQIIDETARRKNTIKKVLNDTVDLKPKTNEEDANEVNEGVASKINAFGRGAANSLTFGGMDYAAAGADYLAKNAAWLAGLGKGTTYSKELKQEKEKTQQAKEQEPGAYTAGEWAPMALPVGGAAKGVYNLGKAAYQGYKASKGMSTGKKALELTKSLGKSLTHPIVPAYQAAKQAPTAAGKAKAVASELGKYAKEIPGAAKDIAVFGAGVHAGLNELPSAATKALSGTLKPGEGSEAFKRTAGAGVETAAPGISDAAQAAANKDWDKTKQELTRAGMGVGVVNPSVGRFVYDFATSNLAPKISLTGEGGLSDKLSQPKKDEKKKNTGNGNQGLVVDVYPKQNK